MLCKRGALSRLSQRTWTVSVYTLCAFQRSGVSTLSWPSQRPMEMGMPDAPRSAHVMVVPELESVAAMASPMNVPVGVRSLTARGVPQFVMDGTAMIWPTATDSVHTALSVQSAVRAAWTASVKPLGHCESCTAVGPTQSDAVGSPGVVKLKYDGVTGQPASAGTRLAIVQFIAPA